MNFQQNRVNSLLNCRLSLYTFNAMKIYILLTQKYIKRNLFNVCICRNFLLFLLNITRIKTPHSLWFTSSWQINFIQDFSFCSDPQKASDAIRKKTCFNRKLGNLLLRYLTPTQSPGGFTCLTVTPLLLLCATQSQGKHSNTHINRNRMQVTYGAITRQKRCINIEYENSVYKAASFPLKQPMQGEYAATAERGPRIKACRTRQTSRHKKEVALVHLMWFKFLHKNRKVKSASSLCRTSSGSVPATFGGCRSPELLNRRRPGTRC